MLRSSRSADCHVLPSLLRRGSILMGPPSCAALQPQPGPVLAAARDGGTGIERIPDVLQPGERLHAGGPDAGAQRPARHRCGCGGDVDRVSARCHRAAAHLGRVSPRTLASWRLHMWTRTILSENDIRQHPLLPTRGVALCMLARSTPDMAGRVALLREYELYSSLASCG